MSVFLNSHKRGVSAGMNVMLPVVAVPGAHH